MVYAVEGPAKGLVVDVFIGESLCVISGTQCEAAPGMEMNSPEPQLLR